MQYEKVLRGQNGDNFQKNASEYVANMYENKKMLHKKNCCKDSHFMYEYMNFQSLEKAMNFIPRLSLCQKCFPIQHDLEK